MANNKIYDTIFSIILQARKIHNQGDIEIVDKENQHNEHEHLISHSAGKPQDSGCVQSQVIVKKLTSSKPKAPTTVILGDSVVKNV